MGLTFAEYVLQPFFPNCSIPDSSVRLLAAVTICKIFFLHIKLFLFLIFFYFIKISFVLLYNHKYFLEIKIILKN